MHIDNKSEADRRRNIKAAFIKEFGCVCSYCGAAVNKKKITLDHIVPLSAGGKTTRSNLLLACLQCNLLKSDMPAIEWCLVLDKRILRKERKLGHKKI